MKNHKRIELFGTIKNVSIQRYDSTQKVKLCVETEDLHEGVMLRLPVTVWEGNRNNHLDLLTIGKTIHIVGKMRVKNQTIASCVEKTARDIVASKVEIV